MAKTLLLADDSVTIQKVVGISFAGEDVDLVTVDNGDDAIAKAREIRPDLVLSDVVMPGKNGYEVCEAIKSDPAIAHIPVLLLTGTFEAFDEERADRCGAAGHVAKPFEAQTLVERVQELLSSPPPAPAPSASPTAPPARSATGSAAARTAVLGQTPVVSRAVPMSEDVGESLGDASDPLEDQSFEFFDDEIAASTVAPAEKPPAPEAPPVDLDPIDSAFAFADDDLDIVSPSIDPTVAMMPEELLSPDGPQEDDDLLPHASRPPADDDSFDFESSSFGESDLLAPLSEEELAHETVLDPKGASGYDVSFSDLGDPQAAAPAAKAAPGAPDDAATVMVPPSAVDVSTPDPAVVASDLFHDEFELDDDRSIPPSLETGLDTGPAPAATPPPTPAQPTAPPEALRSPARTPAPPPEPALAHPPSDVPARPFGAAGPGDVAEPFDEPDPFALPDPSPQPDGVREHAGVAPPASGGISASMASAPAEGEAPQDPSGIAGIALASIEPQLREQLHDTLEKIAWESFGDVTDQIVRKAVERVERIAWEVIPQMAETLIREEIKKLKGEG